MVNIQRLIKRWQNSPQKVGNKAETILRKERERRARRKEERGPKKAESQQHGNVQDQVEHLSSFLVISPENIETQL